MKKFSVILILLFSVAMLSGCVVTPFPPGHVKVKPYKHGPPPHAPAHGYRHRHQHGVEMVFDTAVGAYIVVGHPGIYFFNGIYFHKDTKGFWKSAKHFKGPWHMKDVRKLPMKLKNKSLKKEYKKKEYRRDSRERRGEGRYDKRSDRKYDDDDDRRYNDKSRNSDKRGRGHKDKGWKY